MCFFLLSVLGPSIPVIMIRFSHLKHGGGLVSGCVQDVVLRHVLEDVPSCFLSRVLACDPIKHTSDALLKASQPFSKTLISGDSQ